MPEIELTKVMVNKPLADKLRKELAEKIMAGHTDVV
jgi:hypothetical protein